MIVRLRNIDTVQSKFGSKCEITDKFIDKLSKIGIIERTVSLVDFKENRDLKKTDGKKKMSIKGIPEQMMLIMLELITLINTNHGGFS